MTSTKKDPVLVVVQLSGGNDYLNTVIPYSDGLYYDNRPVVGIHEDRVIKLDDKAGLEESLGPRRHGHNPRHWLRKCPALPLPFYGHLAHL